MKVIVIGGVAAGTKTAAKLKRENPSTEVVIYTKSKDISYAGCGLPYYIGGVIESEDELVVNTPQKFMGLTGVQVYTESEVTAVDTNTKSISVCGETVFYDKLVIAVGAEAAIPPVEGVGLNGVFTVRKPGDAVAIRSYSENCKKAVVIGGGLIGLETAENLMKKGLSVTLIDMASQLMPNIFDVEMADFIRRKLTEKGLRILLGTSVKSILGTEKITGISTTAGEISADMAILAAGIRPATKFLADSGILMEKGCILTDEYAQTNIPDVYAVGDCAMVKNRITGKNQWSAMGSTANIAGRALALTLGGESTPYPGALGTGVVKLAENLNAARTGLTEAQAQEAGFDTVTALCVSDDKAHYYPDSDMFITKLIADRKTSKLLGAQILGAGAVDKMADIAVIGITAGLSVGDFLTADFAYAPPFSTAIHPFATACGVLFNKLSGRIDSFTPYEYMNGAAKGYITIDAHPAPTLIGAEWFDLANAAKSAEKYAKDAKLLLVCARGKRGYLIQNKLKNIGYTNTKVLEGGATFNIIKKSLGENGVLSADEIKRVKGLGCLRDKRYPDVFNVRVITRNGKITTEEHRTVAEAAERFGSGEVAMTTRLTLEIQGVKYENIDPLIAFLAEHDLETGGTGSLVRPIVSCKGTTCQFGLIDTFGLSEQIHERFYKGYHSVTLPHKFKIAVGGCPNNCVKPDLNDLGIVGQLVPNFDFSKCRGCKVCQVEKACPIKIATLADNCLTVDSSSCNACGRCKGKCPFGVTEEYINGYKIYIGGRWGKKMANGRPLSKLFLNEAEVLDTVERAILLFRNEGITGERFADTVARLGFNYVEEKLLHAELNKSEILEKQVKGGATC
ncbi:MAG: FAD-dependent oxidoreductase [Clostridia bacterium]|nr:FAD-dependent oxidoreductase [Clostridia bacterium]